MEHSKCEDMANKLLQRDSKIKFLVEAIEKLGCSLGNDEDRREDNAFVHCKICDGNATGGFRLNPATNSPEIVLCENVQIMRQKRVMQSTMAHELVHAYDSCRVEAEFPSNCLHHACTEIRASNLSGCVRRRAQLSLEGNPACKDRAKEFVDAAWKHCVHDTTPFDYNPIS